MRPIDRFCARLGAGTVVRERPGIGWMLVEVIPVLVWTRITGAFNLEGAYYLVAWLLLLGAREQDLAWLPLLFYGGTALHVVLILRRRDRDGRLAEPRRTSIIDSALGRLLWLAAVLWPVAALWLELDRLWVVGGTLGLIFASQCVLLAGASAWATWIRAIVPERRRGPFFAWRNIASFIAAQLTLLALTASALWPDADASDAVRRDFYTILFAVVTVLALASTLMLARAPRIADEQALRRRRVLPLRAAIRGRPVLWRFAGWNAANFAANACSLTFLYPLLRQAGVADQQFAVWDAWVRLPSLLLGILAAGALLHRLGGGRLILATNLMLSAALAGLCLVDAAGLWLVPVALALDGLGRGSLSVSMLGRLHELIPHGDARFPALVQGVGGIGGVLAATAQMSLLPWLETGDAGAAWWMVAAALTLRLLTTPLLFGIRTEDHASDIADDSPPPEGGTG